MPKTGLSSSQWRQRLHLFAQGKFDFGRGHRPRKGSDRARELERIEKCPKHRNSVLVDPFGRRTQCNCGYHQPQVSEILKMKYYIITLYVHTFHTLLLLSQFSLPPLSRHIYAPTDTSISSPAHGACMAAPELSPFQPKSSIHVGDQEYPIRPLLTAQVQVHEHVYKQTCCVIIF